MVRTLVRQTGLLLPEEVSPTDYVFGGTSGIEPSVRVESGQWDPYLPVPERQKYPEFDTMACVSFSALNVLETLLRQLMKNGVNYSDRYLAKRSGTTENGNYFHTVADTIRHDGSVREEVWPAITTSREAYYSDIPEQIVREGKEWLETFDVRYEWVHPLIAPDASTLKRALTACPLQIAVVYPPAIAAEDVIPRQEGQPNHAVMLYGYEDGVYWKVFDHYTFATKRLAWDYNIQFALKYDLKEKGPRMRLMENGLYQLVEAPGGFALAIGQRLYVDDVAKLLASWAVRNGGNTSGKVGTLTRAQWDSFLHYNLKNEPV